MFAVKVFTFKGESLDQDEFDSVASANGAAKMYIDQGEAEVVVVYEEGIPIAIFDKERFKTGFGLGKLEC